MADVLQTEGAILTVTGGDAGLAQALRSGHRVEVVIHGHLVEEHSSWERGSQQFRVEVRSALLPDGIPQD